MSKDASHPNVWGMVKCGEIVSMYGILHADRKWWQHCPVHMEAEQIKKFRVTAKEILEWQDRKVQRLW